MQHAEAHERLSDLALDPARLARLEIDASEEAIALRGHVASCATCAADLAGWRRTWAEAGAALADPAPLDEIRAPASLRARTLTAALATDRSAVAGADGVEPGRDEQLVGAALTASPSSTPAPAAAPRLARVRGSRRLPWLVAAAAVVVAVVGTSLGLSREADVRRLNAQAAQLEAVVATFDRVLAAQKHWVVTLRAADGTPAGTLAWSSSEAVMVAAGLPAPGADQVYRCWVEQDGTRTAMGTLEFATSTGYWAGALDAYGGGSWRPGARFGVSLVPAGGTPTPVLVGTY